MGLKDGIDENVDNWYKSYMKYTKPNSYSSPQSDFWTLIIGLFMVIFFWGSIWGSLGIFLMMISVASWLDNHS
jgi:hypothetical protein